jgi:hypothetical protein
MSFNKSGTFYYSPDISVAIQTQTGIIDVTQDIMNFSMDREIGQTSTFSCMLNNPMRKYNRLINTLDRITVFLKRTSYIQCFTGVVTYAPIETLVPMPITINASCTLYILENTYWDDTLIQYQSLLLNAMDQAAASTEGTTNDGGVAQAVVNVLYEVCGWNPSTIHIQGIPPNFVEFASNAYSNTLSVNDAVNQGAAAELSSVVGTTATVSGQVVSSPTTTLTNAGMSFRNTLNPPTGAPSNVGFTASTVSGFQTTAIGKSKANFPGKNTMNPVNFDELTTDIYYCSAPFSYLGLSETGKNGKNNVTTVNNAKSWLSKDITNNKATGRIILLANSNTDRVVAVRLTSIPQKPDTTHKDEGVYDPSVDYLQCHPGVVAYLNGAIGDPTAWTTKTDVGTTAKITMAWAGNTIKPGTQANLSSYDGVVAVNGATATAIDDAIVKLIHDLRGQLGDSYTEASSGRMNPGAYGKGKGSFDCSGFAYWGYKQIGITLHGSDTWYECGPVDRIGGNGDYWTPANPNDSSVYGAWIDNTTQPQPGDLLFWQVPSDGGNAPQHVTILTEKIGSQGQGLGKSIHANSTGTPLSEDIFDWNTIKNGQQQSWGRAQTKKGAYVGAGARYIGARRPITLHPAWGKSSKQNTTSTVNVNLASNNDSSGSTNSITNAWSYLNLTPNYNTAASVLQGSPVAFILDNSVMSDLTQIISAGLRSYQSAPNGDFVAWFPDYYGVYGTQPALQISPVEITDFEMYHDDTQLVTHVAVIGDTTGIGAQVSTSDQYNTQGIVSIEDVTTMQILFGQFGNNANINELKTASQDFLNRYGVRPYVTSQSVIHTNFLEYLYALFTFMQMWVNQYTCTVGLTFMPELYPGMRISMDLDNESGSVDSYQFYVTSVQHSGDRTNGFSTTASLTAPVKNGQIVNYGLNLVTPTASGTS